MPDGFYQHRTPALGGDAVKMPSPSTRGAGVAAAHHSQLNRHQGDRVGQQHQVCLADDHRTHQPRFLGNHRPDSQRLWILPRSRWAAFYQPTAWFTATVLSVPHCD